MLVAAYKRDIVGDYRHPLWLTVFGAIVVVLMEYMGVIPLCSNCRNYSAKIKRPKQELFRTLFAC
ncbi:Mn2+/Fe2+ transporter, NRAMP family [Geobacillus proteiniphilus]|uniref:Mn2+/Fe2+ transporter, NRAMP family n=1 Tax=Geobacillus proteiniphilus TaxID=860353 RepID=A0A1Q5SIN7_9BACL|nr:Mn2+/Fe2+ transporter, NRAMP family [Geobacillus proteiniphilus]